MIWQALQPFVDWLGNTSLGLWLGQSTARIAWLFIFHLFGLTIFLGTTLLLSLRLLGLAMRRERVADLFSELGTLNVFGLALMLLSGGLLFTGGAKEYFAGEWFRTKMEFLSVALIFRFTIFRAASRAPEGRFAPLANKAIGVASIALWLAVAASGRAIAYFTP